jgi:pimeloyl-ACP methyl ester carboxylesterase
MALPIVLVPGLLVTARLYAEQIPALWRLGPVSVEIADGIPGALLVTVAGSGHLSTLERPAQVTAALTEWLRA